MKRLLTLTLLAWLISCQAVWAIPTFDAQAEGDIDLGTTATFNHTVGAGCANPIITVDIEAQDATRTINTMTIGGTNGTLIDNQAIAGFNREVFFYRRVGVSTGVNEINVVFSATMDGVHVSSRSYCNVNQTTPTGTPAKASHTTGTTTPTVNVTLAAGDLAIDAMMQRNPGSTESCTKDASQTERDSGRSNGEYNYGGSEESGTGTVTMSWTCTASDVWAIIAVPLKPASRRAIAPIIFQ